MKLTAILLFLIFATSCTIEKRVHNRGWNVQWRKHHSVSQKKTIVSSSERVEFRQAGVIEKPVLAEDRTVQEQELASREEINTHQDFVELSSFNLESDDTSKKERENSES